MSASTTIKTERTVREMVLGGGDGGLFTFFGPSRHAAPQGTPVQGMPGQPQKSRKTGAKPVTHAQIDRARPG